MKVTLIAKNNYKSDGEDKRVETVTQAVQRMINRKSEQPTAAKK